MPTHKKKQKTHLGPVGKRKFHTVMSEFKKGELRHGATGKKVTRPDVALAIAFSEGARAQHKRRKKKAA